MTVPRRYAIFWKRRIAVEDIIRIIKGRDPEQFEFHQAVDEVIETVKPVLDRNLEFRQQAVLARITEPERVLRITSYNVCYTKLLRNIAVSPAAASCLP